MQIKVNINGTDFARWAKEEGIAQFPILRRSRSVIVLNGTMYRHDKEKRGIKIQLVELRDNTLKELLSVIQPLSTVEYTDTKYGNRVAKFYVTVTGATAKKVVGGNTYHTGVTVELEEM